MAKTKTKNEIETSADAEQAMLDLMRIESDLASFYLREAEAVASVRQKFHEGQFAIEKSSLEFKKTQIEKSLKTYAKPASKKWEGKSKETAGGVYGFRLGKPAVALIKSIAKNFENATVNIKCNYPRFNRRVDVLNKELILQAYQAKTLDEERLSECGLEVDQKDKFFVKTHFAETLETAREKLKEA